MRLSLIVTSLVAAASTVVGSACEPGWDLQPLEGGDECVCRSSQDGELTAAPDASCNIEIKDNWNCEPVCWASCPEKPSASPWPMAKRDEPELMPDGTPSRCPFPMMACPLEAQPISKHVRAAPTPTISTVDDSYECILPKEDLSNCGGCSSTGQGRNCGLIPGVRGTSCIEGQCVIYTCQKGYERVVNEQGVQDCVRKGSDRA